MQEKMVGEMLAGSRRGGDERAPHPYPLPVEYGERVRQRWRRPFPGQRAGLMPRSPIVRKGASTWLGRGMSAGTKLVPNKRCVDVPLSPRAGKGKG